MTAEIVNLRKARKARLRHDADVKAAENRSRFGQPKAGRQAREALDQLAERRLEGHRLPAAEPRRDADEPQDAESSGTPGPQA